MLAEMEPAEMDERIAAERVYDPDDPLDRLADILIRGFTALSRSWGAKLEPKHFDPRKDPRQERRGNQPTEGPAPTIETDANVASPNQAAALAACMLGPPDKRNT